VLGVTCALTVGTGILFGLAPALQATRVDVVSALKEVRMADAPRRRRGLGLSQALVVTQIVFSLVLLVGSALFGRTLMKLHAIELGFDRNNILLFTLRPGAVGYQGPALFRLFEDLRTNLRGLPGVQDVSLSAGALPMGGGTMGPFAIVGAEPVTASGGKRPYAAIATVGPTFFRTMHIPVRGRDFTDQDDEHAPKTVIVNHRFAALFGVDNPIGRALTDGKNQFEIVGVVDDALIFTLKEEHRPIVYFPYLQASRAPFGMVYEIRAAGDPIALASAVRQIVRQADVRLAVSDLKTQATHIDQAISSEITLARLCTVFSVLALVIACVGLYGMVAFSVSRRTNEIGIRMTLGAQRAGILWMVLRSVLVMTTVGLVAGLAIALAGSRYVTSLLFGIAPNDPVSLAMAAGVLLACAVFAGWLPARRAARIDPMLAIRRE